MTDRLAPWFREGCRAKRPRSGPLGAKPFLCRHRQRAALVHLADDAVSFPPEQDGRGRAEHARRIIDELHIAVLVGIDRSMPEVEIAHPGREIAAENVS